MNILAINYIYAGLPILYILNVGKKATCSLNKLCLTQKSQPTER